MNTINFPQGISTVSEIQKIVQSSKSYIIVSVLRKRNKLERERFEFMLYSLIYKSLNSEITGIKNAVYWPISELVTNIFEHSKQDKGYVFGQFYPNKNYLDICIVDQGRGLKAAYQEDKKLEFSDSQAIAEFLRGHSTKSDKERGYGVWTSKRLVCEGLKGNFVLISGSVALVSSNSSDKLISLPGFNWQGGYSSI